MRQLSERVKLAVATYQPLIFDEEELKAAKETTERLLPKLDTLQPDAPAGSSAWLIQKHADLIAAPLLRNVGQPVPAARRDEWVAVPSWAVVFHEMVKGSRAARLSDRVEGFYASAKEGGGAALERYEATMGPIGRFTQRAITQAAYGSVDGKWARSLAGAVQVDLVACLMILQLDGADVRDAQRVLQVYEEGRCFASWIEGSDRLNVY
jgi:hypothetical protein